MISIFSHQQGPHSLHLIQQILETLTGNNTGLFEF